MSLSSKEVEKVARLSWLKLTEEERTKFAGQLDQVLEFMAHLQTADTKDVSPTSHAMELSNRLREDEVKPSLSRTEALQAAPLTQDGCFVVPAVMAGRGTKG